MRTKTALWLMLLLVAASLARAETLVKVYVAGKKQDFSPAARIHAGTAYAPLRAAAQAVGATVQWIEARQMAVVCRGDRCINIKKSEGLVVQSRLLIPLRLMAEALQAQVRWDAKQKAVLIQTQALGVEEGSGAEEASP